MYVFANSLSELPEDVRALRQKTVSKESHAGQKTMTLESATPRRLNSANDLSGSDLNRWDIKVHKYETKGEVKASFFGLISSEAKILEAGLVQEAKRFLIKETGKGRLVEFGVSVRLWVAISKKDLDVELTVPNIAASAQLGNSQAKIGLSVAGYVGPLGKLLPSPESLDVENFSSYTESFNAIQALVFGEQGLENLSPVMLGFQEGPKGN